MSDFIAANVIVDPNVLGFNVDTAYASVTAEDIIIDTTNRVIALKFTATNNLEFHGVTLKALYSAVKDAWQGDTGGPGSSNRLIKFPFPFGPITDEQYELVDGWTFDKTNTSDTGDGTLLSTEELIRTGGWQVTDESDVLTEQWQSVISLGELGTAEQVYYERGYKDGAGLVTTHAPEDIRLTDATNQAVQLYAALGSRTDVSFAATGNVITTTEGDVSPFTAGDVIVVDSSSNDGIFTVTNVNTGAGTITVAEQLVEEPAGNATTITADYRKYFKIFCREWQQTYASSSFEGIGVDTAVGGAGAVFQAYRYPLTNTTDPDIVDDAGAALAETTVATGGVGISNLLDPYANVTIDYLRDANGDFYNILQDIADTTAYEVGDVIYYPTDGNWYEVLAAHTTGTGDDPSANVSRYGVYEGQREVGINGNQAFNIIIDADTNVAGNVSGDNRLRTIYQSVQFQLRQNEDIDRGPSSPDGAVTGKTADELLSFVGPTLVTAQGVYIDSFNSQDNNDISLTATNNADGTSQSVAFDFKAQITLNFGDNLVNDSAAKYFLFFANANGNAFGTSNAIIVNDAEDPVAPISGDVNSQSSITRSFDYTGNDQGGRTADSDAPVVGVAIGLNTGQYVSSTTTIERNTTNAISLIAAFERNYTI
jgi:hypothetical protein